MSPPNFTCLLASVPPADKSAQLLSNLLPWLFVLIGGIVAGGLIIYVVRRWLNTESSSSPAGFTLHDLRELHARGELSDEQFEQAKAAMIGRLKTSKSSGGSSAGGARSTASPDASQSKSEDAPQ